MDKVLVICAHPDDETLGPGGTLSLHAIKKDKVSVLIIADGETSRESHSKIEVRQKQAVQACSILGISDVEFLNYPDQKLDSISLLELTKILFQTESNHEKSLSELSLILGSTQLNKSLLDQHKIKP